MIEWIYYRSQKTVISKGEENYKKVSNSGNCWRYRSKIMCLLAGRSFERGWGKTPQGWKAGSCFWVPFQASSWNTKSRITQEKKEARNHVSNVVTEKYTVSLLWMTCFHQQVVRAIYVQTSCTILSLLWSSQLHMKGLLWEMVQMTKWFPFDFWKIKGQKSFLYTFFQLVKRCNTHQ